MWAHALGGLLAAISLGGLGGGFILQYLPSTWAGAGGATLLGEKMIVDAPTARQFGDEMLEEARLAWAQRDGWHLVTHHDQVLVESIRIDHGAFASAGVLLTRATARLSNTSADDVFALMTSVEGYALIDPGSDPEDFGVYNERFEGWRSGAARLEVAPAKVSMGPVLPPREFCVLNAIDPTSRMFVSKSVQHASMPGSSIYADGGAPASGAVRALNTFALNTEDEGEGVVTLRILNYADLVGIPTFMNWLMVKAFLPPLVDRIRQRIQHPPPPAPGGDGTSCGGSEL